MQVTVAFDWRDTAQLAKGRWIEHCLKVAGLQARDWHPIGGNWITGLDEAAVSQEPCFLVFTPGMDPAGPSAMLWQAVAAAGSRRPLVPVVFGDIQLPPLLGSHRGIHIEEDATGDAAQRTLTEAINAIGLLSNADQTGIAHESAPLTIDHSDDLPRLRQVTRLALASASTIGDKSFTRANAGGPQLYIRRDIQDLVTAQLHCEDLTVVSGHAGAGKTSLLWGVARELLSRNDSEVFFVRAAMLTGRADRPPLVTPQKLRGALRQCSTTGARAFVLIDTADVLVGDDDSYLTLMEIVDLVADEHGSILLTSRPAEAGVITTGRKAPIELRSYSLNPGPDGRLAEFDRAVAAHATAYCQSPGDTSALAEQIRAAVIRQQSLGDIARRPLTLRMLFELYAPAIVPETIDATQLFERYWVDRVYRDRRNWAPSGDNPDTDTDLTVTAMRIARLMLKDGVPEVSISDLTHSGPAASIQLEHSVNQLCARGIGQLEELGTFKFFHQTFFEFAAAKDLLGHGPSALDLIIERAYQRPDDYFLQSVVEQTWICAWRRNDQYRQSAATLTTEVLASADLHENPRAPFVLRRCALVVAAQSPIDPDTRELICTTLRNPATEGVIVRDFLSHLPRPGRPWGVGDTDIVMACFGRGDSSWHAAIEVLTRLVRAQPQEALASLTTLAGCSCPVGVISPTTLIRKPTRDMLAALLPGHTDEVLRLLSDAMAADPRLRQNTVLEKIFDMLDTASDSAIEIARWADEIRLEQGASTVLLEKFGRLHQRAIAGLLDHTDAAGEIAQQLLTAFSAKLETIATSPGRHPPVSAIAFCWGMLTALGESHPDGLSPSSHDELVGDTLDLLIARHEPQVHEQIHQGWLVGLVGRNPAVRQWAAQTLIDGLPASHRDPQTAQQRWADTVRRVLERSDTNRDALIAIITQVGASLGAQHDIREIWTHPDLLLRLLLPAACAEFPAAQSVLAATIDGTVALDDHQARILVQQAQRLKPDDAENGAVIELLTVRGEYEELKQLCTRNPGARWTAKIAASTRDSAIRDALSDRLRQRRAATGFLKQATSSGVIPYPEHLAVAATMSRSRDSVVRADLAEISSEAVNAGLFPADAVITMLRERLSPVVNAGHLNRDHEATVLRRTLVGLLGLHGNENDIDEALSLAFLPDVETNTIIALAGFLIPQRRSHPIPVHTAVELVAEVGIRFTALSRAPRDVAGAWRPVFGQLLNHADDDALLTLVAQLPSMAPLYAAVLISRLPHRRGSRITVALAEMASSSSAAAELKRAIALYLDRIGGPSAGWLELDRELAALANPPPTSAQ